MANNAVVQDYTKPNVYKTSNGNQPTTANDATETAPVGVSDLAYTATPVYADQPETSAPAEGGSPSPREASLSPDTTLIENDLYE